MMQVFKSPRVWLFFCIFLVLRIVFSFRIPIFNDESTYLRWGLGVLEHPGQWWQYMADGKQPLVAITYGLLQMLPTDPLITARLFPIACSAVTFWVVAMIIRRFTVKTGDMVSLLLLAACPLCVLLDTLALAESPVNMCFAVLLYLTLSGIERPALTKGLCMGLTLGLGWWYKSTTLLAVPLIVLSFLISVREWKASWKTVFLMFVIAAGIALLFILPLYLIPAVNYSGSQTIVRIRPPGSIFSIPFAEWSENVRAIADWMIGYIGPVIVIAGCIAVLTIRRSGYVRILLLWIITPVVLILLFLYSISARYIFMISIPCIVLAGIGLSRLNRSVRYALAGASLLAGIVMSVSPLTFYRLLTPLRYTRGDYSQYVVGWTSGWGVREAADELINNALFTPIVVFVQLHGGNPEEAIPVYLLRHGIPVFQLYSMSEIGNVPDLVARPWYFVSRGPDLAGFNDYFVETKRFGKPLDPDYVGVYIIRHKGEAGALSL
jgi:hypothetical protein